MSLFLSQYQEGCQMNYIIMILTNKRYDIAYALTTDMSDEYVEEHFRHVRWSTIYFTFL